MRRLLVLAVLAGCKTTSSGMERVTWPDDSQEKNMWACRREVADGHIECVDYAAVTTHLIQQLPEWKIDEIRLQAPDRTAEGGDK